ncbi:TPA: hypothetical protein N0F65_003184 [Lagenidium giganteum]|uniref:Acyltransferase n=1 Tax=Lagenidium giganteum TaxID=4803 RepID=A0AAV2Z6L9_9STRA|nr:TPA: hypothetical protein N0F65_003184 [Lagenidium giganteum]
MAPVDAPAPATSKPSTDDAPAPATTVKEVKRPVWPNNNERPELRTLKGRFARVAMIASLYFLWVVGLLIYSSLTVFSALSFVHAIVFFQPVHPVAVGFVLVMMAYYSYHLVLFPGQGPWMWMRHFIRDTLTKYPYFRYNKCVFEEFPDEEDDLKPLAKPDEKAMYAFHPHGILSCGWSFNGAHHMRFAEAKAKWLVAENLFWYPVMRDVLNWVEFGNVAKETFVSLMSKGKNLCVIPGGFEEATIYQHGKHRLYLNCRFGFIKLALQYGYKIHPVYTFGEEMAYYAFPYFLKFRLWLNTLKIPGAVFMGNPFCSILPLPDVDLITVVGKPMQFPKIENPTKEDVKKYHALYVKAVVDLFERNKAKYAVDPNATLEIM